MIDNGLGNTSLVQDSQNLGFGFWQAIVDPAIMPFDPFANGVMIWQSELFLQQE